jgi:hypothetical protein
MPELRGLAGDRIGDPHRVRVAATECRSRETGHWRNRDAARGTSAPSVSSASSGLSAPSSPSASSCLRLERGSVRIAQTSDALLRLLTERETGPANERDALGILGPGRARVEVHARRQVLQRACRDLVDADETVIGPLADERDVLAVRRPSGRIVRAPCRDERRFAAIARGGRPGLARRRSIDLAVSREKNRAAIRRELGR